MPTQTYRSSVCVGARSWVIHTLGRVREALPSPLCFCPATTLRPLPSPLGHSGAASPSLTSFDTITQCVDVSNRVFSCDPSRIFGVDIQGRDCGDEVAQWFTNFLKTEALRLVQFDTKLKGRTSDKLFPVSVQNYQVAYPDCSPLMIISEASLGDLNTRLEKKIKMEQFRPNIVVRGCEAYEEDTWDELLIGGVELKKVLACPRCILTTVDPDTGVIDRKEPLETLKSYRLCDPSEHHIYKSSPLFGMYYSVEKIGSLKVGDPVYRLV